jgi:polyisoprenoid-binding protein YceI
MKNALLALGFAGWLVCGAAQAQAQDGRYVVDGAQSDFHWLVYKAGTLARLGHNHTIAAGDLTGSVTVAQGDRSASRFELAFSSAKLVIDDPTLRSTLGPDFASVPSADDIAGTRKNMLTDKVLDGEKFPGIRVVGTGPTTRDGKQTLAVEVSLLGRTVSLTVPTDVTIDGSELRAKGAFELNHSDLGMQPFTVMLGALAVGEKLSFSYDIRATRDSR